MARLKTLLIFALSIFSVHCQKDQAEELLESYGRDVVNVDYEAGQAAWVYNTNLTDHNSKLSVAASLKYSKYAAQVRLNASKINTTGLSYAAKRQFKFILSSASSKDETVVKKVAALGADLESKYSKGCVQARPDDVKTLNISAPKCLSLDPDLTQILRKSRNYSELQFAWKGWRDATGPKMKPVYEDFVKNLNIGAKENGMKDYGEYVRSWYEVGDQLGPIAEKLWLDLKPFYEELHAYVRFKLSKKYPQVKDGEPIPAHLLGNMWAQDWVNIYDMVAPYPNEPKLDVSAKLASIFKDNVTGMFRKAEDFFVSIGWEKLPDSFWKKSMLEKPKDGRSVVCHASAWDFAINKDVRVKMCTNLNQDDFFTVHHELGHIYYYLLYWDLPYVFRTGANPGFHEAVGDTIALSVETPQHLHKVGLLDTLPNNNRSEINFLLKTALSKIAFIPFGYLMDQWRWGVFDGSVKPEAYTSKWWELRTKYQGIKPPVERSSSDFDPGAKYHIPGNTPYIRYFMSYVYQFHFHKAGCKAAGHKGTLNKCSIYQSKAAGKRIGDMLSMGKSKPWQVAFKNITGYRDLTAQPIKDYFQVLYDWMKEQRKNEGYSIGWEKSNEADNFLKKYNQDVRKVSYEYSQAAWVYNTNLTDHNSKLNVDASLKYSKYAAQVRLNASKINTTGLSYSSKRQFKFILSSASSKNETVVKKVAALGADLESKYSKGCVQARPDDVKTLNISAPKCLSLDPDLTQILRKSRNYSELQFAWKGWRDATGPKMKPVYEDFVKNLNIGAKENGMKDYGEYVRSWYEVGDQLGPIAEKLWLDLKPFYEELHAYVRFKLSKKYPQVKDGEPIPAHLLGNMWAQEWVNIYDMVAPYPDEPKLDVSAKLASMFKNNVTEMFRKAEDFFVSIGWEKLPDSFWKKSMLEKPKDGRSVVCHASAWDFAINKDVRVKMCTNLNQDDFTTVHHELGHIYYYLLYWDLPYEFRTGANPGFHEAVGDTISLSVETPQHLHKVGLLDTLPNNTRSELNFLLKTALTKIAFIPFGYLMDQWRWGVFDGSVKPEAYTSKWWELRTKYQGIKPPVERSSSDFDPGAKYHIPGNTPYIRYFMSYVYQFHFHKAGCKAAGHKGTLNKCSIYQSKAAGKKIGDMLSMGKSKPWQDAFEKITGYRDLTAQPIKDYFQVLYDWMKEQRKKEDYSIGWGESINAAKTFLKSYNRDVRKVSYEYSQAAWVYNTNLTDHNSKLNVDASLKYSKYAAQVRLNASKINTTGLSYSAKRQFKFILSSASSKDEKVVKKVAALGADLESQYSKGCVQANPDDVKTLNISAPKCLSLDPDLTQILRKSRNYSELQFAWKGWRDATGPKMKTVYEDFVKNLNIGAKENGMKDYGEYVRSWYEVGDQLGPIAEKLWLDLKPFYEELHAYVRFKLSKKYPQVKDGEPIPAHLLGNMWAQEWVNIYDMVAPYPDEPKLDVSAKLASMFKNNVTEMFRKAEDFFVSIGWEKLPDSFWKKSMLEKPKDGRSVVCHASAWDFAINKDVRVKMCTNLNQDDFTTVHHELGHIYYYLLYWDLPYEFRTGANPGFHEAVGDTISLSVETPQHLHKVGLLDTLPNNTKSELNFLLKTALSKIAFIPFGYLMDQWRWGVFDGSVKPEAYTSKWWELRTKYQGIKPPVERSCSDFDPGAKYHIPGNTPYIRYFMSYVYQFHFHKAGCKAAGHKGTLNKCSIYQSKAAGKRIGDMLSMGKSKPWQDAFEKITGYRELTAQPIKDYFQVLYDWMKEQRKKEGYSIGWEKSTNAAEKFLKSFNQNVRCVSYESSQAAWVYNTNLTDHNSKLNVNASLKYSKYAAKVRTDASKINTTGLSYSAKRQFKFILSSASSKDEKVVKKVASLKAELKSQYSKGCVQARPDDVKTLKLSAPKCLSLDPDLTQILRKSRNYSELQFAWKGWRDAAGPKMKPVYEDFVKNLNIGAKENGMKDYGEYVRSWYEVGDQLGPIAEKLWLDLKPFYEELHAYVRFKLSKKYPQVKDGEPIPAHLLGNMWAQSWVNIYDMVAPYPNEPQLDVSAKLASMFKNNVTGMFRKAEDFFVSIGWEKLPDSFWKKSMLEKPKDGRSVVCHASAWDFAINKDVRVKMCTSLNQNDFTTIHHELGHIYYYLLYWDLPYEFRTGANPGFHEAVGDTISLSVGTPQHLHKVGLLDTLPNNSRSELNFLLKTALTKIAFIPFGYLMDQWRWGVFDGSVKPEAYTSKWWELRTKYQGIKPPVERSSKDFDPGAKYHIPNNTPYIRYFMSYVYQFHFHKAGCKAAGHKGTLNKCSIYQSKAAGKRIGDMLSMGKSKPWQDAFKNITGYKELTAQPIKDYFQVLYDWMKEQRKNEGYSIGWEKSTNAAERFLKSYNRDVRKVSYEYSQAAWVYNTNLTDHNSKLNVNASLKYSKYAAKVRTDASKINTTGLSYSAKRQFKFILSSASSKDEKVVKKVASLKAELKSQYSKGCVQARPDDVKTLKLSAPKCLSLDPDLTQILRKSRNYSELQFAWKGWRDAAGPKMKSVYEDFVKNLNIGAKENGMKDYGEYVRSWYEVGDQLGPIAEKLWLDLKPFYEELHAYVRFKLSKKYPQVKDGEPIPAHLLGNMWAQEWVNIYDMVAPYPNEPKLDVSAKLASMFKNNVTEMFRKAEDFFVSIGWEKLPDSFWKKSMLEKPKDGRSVVCHASAWDFAINKDVRVKMCTNLNQDDFITIHHELGHIYYFLLYWDLPYEFRTGANPGFHEAVGDTISLSVETPQHLHKVGLLDALPNNDKSELNFLLKTALSKIAFIPFGYLMDQWRWGVFDGSVKPEAYTSKWWELRTKYQGIKPPVERSSTDFDPGAKYHIPNNTPYIRYFMSYVYQFHFHKAGCKAAGHKGTLNKCSIYQSKAAGKRIGDMLSMGKSKPWQDAFKNITGYQELTAQPIKDYFQVLYDWMKEQRKKEGYSIGWEKSTDSYKKCSKLENHCKNGGDCYTGIDKICVCKGNFYGPKCEKEGNPKSYKKCSKSENHCKNGGECLTGIDKICVCKENFYGAKCENEGNPTFRPSVYALAGSTGFLFVAICISLICMCRNTNRSKRSMDLDGFETFGLAQKGIENESYGDMDTPQPFKRDGE